MNSIGYFFYLVLYQPLFNILVLLCKYLPWNDLGFAIIILTILIKLALYPLAGKAIKSQKALAEIQPKIKEAQEKYKNDKEAQGREMLAIYKREKINPFSGLVVLFIQLPILIALYQLFWSGIGPGQMKNLYSFISFSGQANSNFLGFLNLSGPNWGMALVAGALQYWQAKMLIVKNKPQKTSDFSDQMQRQMTFFMPGFTFLLLLGLPSALGLYWVTTTLFTIIQQYLVIRADKNASK